MTLKVNVLFCIVKACKLLFSTYLCLQTGQLARCGGGAIRVPEEGVSSPGPLGHLSAGTALGECRDLPSCAVHRPPLQPKSLLYHIVRLKLLVLITLSVM